MSNVQYSQLSCKFFATQLTSVLIFTFHSLAILNINVIYLLCFDLLRLCLTLIYIFFTYRHHKFTHFTCMTSCLLGLVFSYSLVSILYISSLWTSFSLFIAVCSFFHFSEFYTTSIIKPNKLHYSSFLLDHSFSYWFMISLSLFEYFIEVHFLPKNKQFNIISGFGLFMCIAGESVRKLAMLTAKSNFDHHVLSYKHHDHVLVTNGIYSLWRHPSYVGWFYWSIGTQVLMQNKICTILFAIASWMFFHERIAEEEMYLLRFFGSDYSDYQRKVGTGLPFIKGYIQSRCYHKNCGY